MSETWPLEDEIMGEEEILESNLVTLLKERPCFFEGTLYGAPNASLGYLISTKYLQTWVRYRYKNNT